MALKTRSAPRWFIGASLVTSLGVSTIGCSTSTGPEDSSPPVDTGTPDVTSDEPLAYYGPIRVDSGSPADVRTDEPVDVDSGTPADVTSDEPLVAFYGPIRVDSGVG